MRIIKFLEKKWMKSLLKATKAPSSVNMQPWRIAVVESDEMKEKS